VEMAGDKTAALMACACTIGAVHVGASPELAMGLAEFGGHVGLAFQLTDDLLGIWGATEVTGKPVMADLRSRKKSLPVVAALTSGTAEGAELKVLLAREDELSEDDLVRAADLIVAAGGKAWAEKEADDRLAAAAASLDDIGIPAEVRAEFLAIAEFITARQW
jgi:geranylgeranyl diphosphate synthase type I